MKRVKFVFGIHNHQPVGNFDFVFEEAYQKSYLPFLEVLERHPKIRIAIHFTGILLDWLEIHHPELLELVKKLRERGQLEILSGGYYEPIISVIPPRDRIGQIKKLTRRVKQLFDYDASGMWLAERVWEPTLPTTLAEAGIKYTVVDDTHFKYAGLKDEDLTGYYTSEDLGNPINLFPISKDLRYTIPFQDPQATIEVLRKLATEEGDHVLVFADDGEKFGVWPDTYKHVYEDRWLDRFFSALEENLDWIEMTTFDEVLKTTAPRGSVYLPTASYAEMMHWALFRKTYKAYEDFEHYLRDHNMYDEVGIFVRGGFWRNFMTKYPEINIMHKKMLRVSDKLWHFREKNPQEAQEAFDALWAGQCNCPFWHGVFGGLYLSHLRFAIFQNLIHAEKLVTELQPDILIPYEETDFDKDGFKEILMETPLHDLYLKPSEGGMIIEYDFKPCEKNLADTMSRREEGYHGNLARAKVVGVDDISNDGTASIHDLVLAKEPGLEKYLIYDDYERKSLIDHFLDPQTTVEEFYRGNYRENGDFVKGRFEVTDHRVSEESIQVVLRREGEVKRDGQSWRVELEKKISLWRESGRMDVEYHIRNRSEQPMPCKFAVEFNYGLQAGHADDRYYYLESGKPQDPYLDSMGVLDDQPFIGLRDEYMKIDVRLSAGATRCYWRLPVETISLSEAGFEKVYQSSAVLPVWDLTVEKDVVITITQWVEKK
ncbi:MAG TPA: DUF1926 domain-containing protein [Caldithrix abyssi]|uniref:DUF1926 domain-containing protein n=1 Tax=Caldithrix abyssi TaxID=187145 RepID=A0A7V5RQE1_CALAY|nr:DUF1926 domain-containing protein [Caldithrix abyssi]